uniref:K-box domain-containing protein n=1 Tax=Daucus carota subsp. sativus TaxID=79200 RepID=A0A161XW96_DAUCS
MLITYKATSCSMKLVIDKYNKAKAEHYQSDNQVTEAKLWERETTVLRRQVQDLQGSHRQLMGEELSGLNTKDLQNLETQLEMSLHCVRMRKVDQMHQENINLNKKVNDKKDADGTNRNGESSKNQIDAHAHIRLQLCQPQ